MLMLRGFFSQPRERMKLTRSILLFARHTILPWEANLLEAGGADSDDPAFVEPVSTDGANSDAAGVDKNAAGETKGGSSKEVVASLIVVILTPKSLTDEE